MFKFEYYYDEDQKDSCDIFDEQCAYFTALGLRNACVQIGK